MDRTAALELGWATMRDAAPTDERALLVAAVGGDRVARDRLLSDAARLTLPVAYRLLGDRDEARDVCQEVMIRLHRSLARLDTSRSVGPYVRRIAVNVCRDQLAKRSRSVREVTSVELPRLAAAGPGVDTQVDRRRLRDSIQACLDRLPEGERTAFVLCRVQGLTSAEAGEQMQCSAVTVRGYVHRARKRVREMLVDMHPDLVEDGHEV